MVFVFVFVFVLGGEELTFIRSTNAECLPGADTAGHWDTENMKLVIGQHETAWHQTALVIPKHSQ